MQCRIFTLYAQFALILLSLTEISIATLVPSFILVLDNSISKLYPFSKLILFALTKYKLIMNRNNSGELIKVTVPSVFVEIIVNLSS